MMHREWCILVQPFPSKHWCENSEIRIWTIRGTGTQWSCSSRGLVIYYSHVKTQGIICISLWPCETENDYFRYLHVLRLQRMASIRKQIYKYTDRDVQNLATETIYYSYWVADIILINFIFVGIRARQTENRVVQTNERDKNIKILNKSSGSM